jgi:hypothetical protein
MKTPGGRFERLVRATFPGSAWGGRLLLIELLVPAAGIGLGVGLVRHGLDSHHANVLGRSIAVIGGAVVLGAVFGFAAAYCVTLVRAVQRDRNTPGEGRHAAR